MTTSNPAQKEIWLVDFNPSKGAEIKKTRPAVVVGSDGVGKLPLRVVVPLTEWKQAFANYPWHVLIEADSTTGLSKDSSADTLQIRSVAVERFNKRLGKISASVADEIKYAAAIVLDIPAK